MNAGIGRATKDVRSTFDRVMWVAGDPDLLNDQHPRVVVPFVTRTGRHAQTTLSAEDSAHEFHRALGVALTVISELDAALRATQDVASAAIDRALALSPPLCPVQGFHMLVSTAQACPACHQARETIEDEP